MAFPPQRPYLPLGTLRNAVTYPSPPEAFLTADVRCALERCDFGSLLLKPDLEEQWDRELSAGEQERIALARLLLHKPGWVFLDEATAALDVARCTSWKKLARRQTARLDPDQICLELNTAAVRRSFDKIGNWFNAPLNARQP